jgi:putative oxidoreductase
MIPIVTNNGPNMNDNTRIRSIDYSLLLVRVVVGSIFLAHGAQKLLGAFGGPGLAGVVEGMGPLGYFVTVGEFFGALGLLFGVLPRFSAGALVVIMLGAIGQVHGAKGFFASDGGFEYNLALIGLLLPILISGPGRLAVSEHLRLGPSTSKKETGILA